MYGQWKIVELEYEKKDLFDNLYYEYFWFKEENVIKLPKFTDQMGKLPLKGFWKINKSNDSLSINSSDSIFTGDYSIKFAMDEEGAVYAQLVSNKSFIILKKMDFFKYMPKL
tara:strand:+ start:1089 stop:1424 length:336 start_codon:yes stop_codon:yes gene_type:complete